MNDAIEPVAPQFEQLSPELIMNVVEQSFDLALNGIITPYSSYINRVYGLEGDSGDRYVVKFYRPDRWSTDAILEEHRFVLDCIEDEFPVVPPKSNSAGSTLQTAIVETDSGELKFHFALYESRGGRLFDAEGDENWLRIGALVGRLHRVGRSRGAELRMIHTPVGTTRLHLEELRNSGVVHPDCETDFFDLANRVTDYIIPLFESVTLQRIHGDCHRGNILDRSDGLLLIDFDDMVMGPPVQDIWLLLPDYADSSRKELELILEGYEAFGEFDRNSFVLIEPLRFMRMIHFLAWSAIQRNDLRFQNTFPDWGGKSFWIKEVEDLRLQARVIGA